MPEEGQRRFPKWLHWVGFPFKAVGVYLALSAGQPLLGVAFLAGGMFLTYYFAFARKPA